MAKTIKIPLSVEGFQKAIDAIKKYRADIKAKTEKLAKRIASEIQQEALSRFAQSVCDDIVNSGPRPASVSVSIEPGDGVVLVIANGEDAVWCEFGAGVTYNGSPGQSPHPKGEELGFTIGSYGKGFGARKVWGYYNEDDGLVLTRGTAATMPMYNAMKEVASRVYEIAKEVFA